MLYLKWLNLNYHELTLIIIFAMFNFTNTYINDVKLSNCKLYNSQFE